MRALPAAPRTARAQSIEETVRSGKSPAHRANPWTLTVYLCCGCAVWCPSASRCAELGNSGLQGGGADALRYPSYPRSRDVGLSGAMPTCTRGHMKGKASHTSIMMTDRGSEHPS